MGEGDELKDQDEFVVAHIDPMVRRLLEAPDCDKAYEAANEVAQALANRPDLANGGALYIAWSELTDVFETGRTPQEDADAALREAATQWLARCDPTGADLAGASFYEAWVHLAGDLVHGLYARDGNFWTVGTIAGTPYWLSEDGGGRVDVRLGDGLPVMLDALRDCLGTRRQPGQRDAVRKRVERAIRLLEARAGDRRAVPFASGRRTTLCVVDGRVEARYCADLGDKELMDTASVEEVMNLLMAWRRRIELLAGK